jgi:hypothetical protein
MAAEILKCTPDNVRRLCGIGKIKAFKVAHDWLFYEHDFNAYLKTRKNKDVKDGKCE